MTTIDYKAMYAAALEEVGGLAVVFPDNSYEVEIKAIKAGETKTAKKFSVGLRLDPTSGPYAGQACWVNQTYSPENPKAAGVFLRIIGSLGVPAAAIQAGQPPEELVKYIVKGTRGVAVLASHPWNGEMKQDLKSFRITNVPETFGLSPAVGAVAAVPAPVVAVAAPVAVPVPQPVAAPVAAPVAVVVAPVAPQPVVAEPPEVAALKAQLAAIQAQQGGAAPAAPVPSY